MKEIIRSRTYGDWRVEALKDKYGKYWTKAVHDGEILHMSRFRDLDTCLVAFADNNALYLSFRSNRD